MKLPNKRIIVYLFWAILLSQCSSIKPVALRKDISSFVKNSSIFSNQFTGLSIYDPVENKFLANINDHIYFTPASNMKILTLATVLNTKKGDSIPTFLHERRGDTLYLLPLGDPTLLHPDFETQAAFRYLQNSDATHIRLIKSDAWITPYGPGWAWDDYRYKFQPERSILPLYGNTVNIISSDTLIIEPSFFYEFVDENSLTGAYRSQSYNSFHIPKPNGHTLEFNIPCITSMELTTQLLRDTLNKSIDWIDDHEFYRFDTLYNEHFSPLLAIMMKRSDNFLAEQLLINAQVTAGYKYFESFQKNIANTKFSFLSDSLIWVDGSGLSRYNMITPMSLLQLLSNIYRTVDWWYIEMVFPVGGESGTIRQWYDAEEPYVFAKTGTLRHNHNLSGFLKTRSGKILIFSFMNNHFTSGSPTVKIEMQKLLKNIRDAY